ncbi:eCIS core domain-containing protein [Microscilla marina]|uniref:eCIS core domain-containing protein n=1 Tax=Microscilla marina ATCC 23134 TaxID=313606 RepID=A1ZFZ9_MICM2|nr:DUF4157 domain-containing protein [Microscilla marina]EAY30923.1 hypothetical protein M23134_01247 [Microscilla marina ATCC 23134]
MSKIQQGNEADQNQQQVQDQPTVQKKESPEVIQNKLAQAIRSPQSDLPPIQSKQGSQSPIPTKQSGMPPIQSKEGQRPTLQAKQRPIQRNTSNGKSSGNVNEAQVKTNVSNIMGVDVTQAKVNYNSSKPAQLKAEAYAQGNTVEIAPGKEKHLGHELAHIGQQAQGRVQPTIQGNNGVGINNDPQLEKEADDIGDQAMSMKPAQLKQGGGMKSSVGNTQQGAPVQGYFVYDNAVKMSEEMAQFIAKQLQHKGGLTSFSKAKLSKDPVRFEKWYYHMEDTGQISKKDIERIGWKVFGEDKSRFDKDEDLKRQNQDPKFTKLFRKNSVFDINEHFVDEKFVGQKELEKQFRTVFDDEPVYESSNQNFMIDGLGQQETDSQGIKWGELEYEKMSKNLEKVSKLEDAMGFLYHLDEQGLNLSHEDSERGYKSIQSKLPKKGGKRLSRTGYLGDARKRGEILRSLEEDFSLPKETVNQYEKDLRAYAKKIGDYDSKIKKALTREKKQKKSKSSDKHKQEKQEYIQNHHFEGDKILHQLYLKNEIKKLEGDWEYYNSEIRDGIAGMGNMVKGNDKPNTMLYGFDPKKPTKRVGQGSQHMKKKLSLEDTKVFHLQGHGSFETPSSYLPTKMDKVPTKQSNIAQVGGVFTMDQVRAQAIAYFKMMVKKHGGQSPSDISIPENSFSIGYLSHYGLPSITPLDSKLKTAGPYTTEKVQNLRGKDTVDVLEEMPDTMQGYIPNVGIAQENRKESPQMGMHSVEHGNPTSQKGTSNVDFGVQDFPEQLRDGRRENNPHVGVFGAMVYTLGKQLFAQWLREQKDKPKYNQENPFKLKQKILYLWNNCRNEIMNKENMRQDIYYTWQIKHGLKPQSPGKDSYFQGLSQKEQMKVMESIVNEETQSSKDGKLDGIKPKMDIDKHDTKQSLLAKLYDVVYEGLIKKDTKMELMKHGSNTEELRKVIKEKQEAIDPKALESIEQILQMIDKAND